MVPLCRSCLLPCLLRTQVGLASRHIAFGMRHAVQEVGINLRPPSLLKLPQHSMMAFDSAPSSIAHSVYAVPWLANSRQIDYTKG